LVAVFLQVFGPDLRCFFRAPLEHPKTPQNSFRLFGKQVLAHLGPTKPAETRRAGAELKRVTHPAFLSGWRCGRREATQGTTVEDHAAPMLQDDAAAAPLRRPTAAPSRRPAAIGRPTLPLTAPTFLLPPTRAPAAAPPLVRSWSHL
jgi:hypothetical protein